MRKMASKAMPEWVQIAACAISLMQRSLVVRSATLKASAAAYAEQGPIDDRVGVAYFAEVVGCMCSGQNVIDILHKLRGVLRDTGIEDRADNVVLVDIENLTGRMRVRRSEWTLC